MEDRTLTPDFVAKLKAIGLNVIKPTDAVASPTLNIPIKETKEVAIALCAIANTAINKTSFLDFNLGKKLFDAGVGIGEVPSEVMDIDENEVLEIHQTVVENLNFDNPDAKRDERLAEQITLGVLIIVLGIAERAR